MGTIPIYWGETGDFGEALAGTGTPHWGRAELERCYRLRPLDYLSAEALSGQQRLLLAQPRGFSPEENVALDAWVRQGGRLLLFADPWMTGESRFAIGDRRRPQDVILLSPILAHWGLKLAFDPQQSPDPTMREIAGTQLPIAMAGELTLVGEGSKCAIGAARVSAQCHVGEGLAVIVADAALLDMHEIAEGAPAALLALAEHTFKVAGDGAGWSAPLRQDCDKNPKKQLNTEEASLPAASGSSP